MKASQIDNRQNELFQPRLSGQLNQKNELLVLGRMIPWDDLEVEFADLYQSNSSVGGQPPKPIRLMIGILLLQHLHNLSDEQVVRGWVDKSEAIATRSNKNKKSASKILTGSTSAVTIFCNGISRLTPHHSPASGIDLVTQG
jgi:hypothetical protein